MRKVGFYEECDSWRDFKTHFPVRVLGGIYVQCSVCGGMLLMLR